MEEVAGQAIATLLGCDRKLTTSRNGRRGTSGLASTKWGVCTKYTIS